MKQPRDTTGRFGRKPDPARRQMLQLRIVIAALCLLLGATSTLLLMGYGERAATCLSAEWRYPDNGSGQAPAESVEQ
jgi:hypothetical protein